MSVFAAIDCGTNSIRLLVSRVESDGSLTELNRDNIVVRLGQGVDATGRFADEALERVDAALGVYADRMLSLGASDVVMGATSATRDAANREEFFALTRRHLGRVRAGAQAEVISGEREAELSFAGAVIDLPAQDGHTLVFDLGGGSTEFVVDAGRGGSYSTRMGCVRLTERFLHSDPPVASEVSAAGEYVAEQLALAAAQVDFDAVTRVVGVAGTVTTLTAVHLGLDDYDATRTHMATLPLTGFRDTARRVLSESVAVRRAYPVMHPGRADVIGGGCIVLDAVTSRFLEQGLETITVSEKDILDGLLAEVITRNR
ncbi:Ppx/GppA phosphatase family protein [uncultured Corynebacterium sp.]|uniref:Ppx/GppA phosphatase family protein n=1 Tax=uncultured Corynebacterium sp. TaxID=159447 RepID=UPI0025FF5BB1|nr:Ppx/GppA phosphatase family protein [uncultured Corynebacterium sp.]